MKRLILLGAILAGLIIPSAPAFARVISTDNPTVGPNEVINDDLFVSGKNIDIEGTVNGDVYAAGQSVTFRGTVNGTLYAAGQSVNVSGNVRDDVVTAGQNITVTNLKVGDSLITLGQSVTTDSSSTIGGGMAVGAQTLLARAPIGRGLTGGIQMATLANTVGRGADLAVERLILDSSAHINGDLNYTSPNQADIHDGATVTGNTNQHYVQSHRGQAPKQGANIAFRLWSFLCALLIGLLLVHLIAKPTRKTVDNILNRPWMALGAGFLALAISVPLFILLIITLIGIPLAFIGATLFAISIYLSKIFFVLAVAGWANRKYKFNLSTTLQLILGLILYYLLVNLPVLGWLVGLAGLLFGLGGIVMALFFRSPKTIAKEA